MVVAYEENKRWEMRQALRPGPRYKLLVDVLFGPFRRSVGEIRIALVHCFSSTITIF